MISDNGIDTLFDAEDERGNPGREIARNALQRAGAGGTLALNLWGETPPVIARAVREQGWHLHRISAWEELLAFARDFSRRHCDGRLRQMP
jgi:hypothetical protein